EGKFHIGANSDQNIDIKIDAMDLESLALEECKVDMTAEDFNVEELEEEGKNGILTQNAADKAIKTFDDAINNDSTHRAKSGAIQNSLEHTIHSLGASAENLTAAESRIRDTGHDQVA